MTDQPKQKVNKWIGFFEGTDKQLTIHGHGMVPNLYDTEEEARKDTAEGGFKVLGVFEIEVEE